MGIFDRLRKRKQDNLTSAIHGINEEQDNVFNGMHGAAVPGASADGDSSATDDAAVVTTPEGISPATMDGSKGGLRTLHSSMDKNLSLGAFSQTSLTPDIPSSQTADESLRRIQAAPAATSPTEVSTSSSATGNAVTEPKNASQGNVGNNSATVTQGESMNNLEESQNGGQVSVAKKVVRDDLSGMSDADLASRIEKIEQGRDRLKGKGVTDEQIDAILGDLHGELNGRKAKGLEGNAAGNIVSGTPETVVSSGVEKKGGSDNLSNADNNGGKTADVSQTASDVNTYTEKKRKAAEEMSDKSVYNGNVDLLKRPSVDSKTMKAAGYDVPDGSYASVYSSQAGYKDKTGKEREVLYTPILPDGKVMTQKEVDDYFNGLADKGDILELDKPENGGKGLVIAIDVKGDLGPRLHELQETYYGTPSQQNTTQQKVVTDASNPQQDGKNLSDTDNSSSTTTDPNSTTISTTTGSGANTDLSKSGNNTDANEDKKANDSETKSKEKGGDVDSRQGYGSKIIKLKDNTPKGWPYTEDGSQSGESTGKDKAAGRSNLDDYSAKELEGLTDEQKEQIKNGSVLVVDKDGNKKVVEGTPVINERQLTAEQNKKEGEVIKTREQVNKEIERLADIKEGDSAELKKLKRERAKLSYEIENMPPFVPEEAIYPDMPKKVKTDVNYKRVLERIEKERKDRGDDPETKAKREKAHKANLVVASISDLLSGAINLWGAAHGAKSLDLKSGVAKLEKKHKDQIDEGLKIAEQETKELEKAMKEDRDFDKAVNDDALAEYKEVCRQLRELTKARNTAGQKQWDAKRAELMELLKSASRHVDEQIKHEHRKAINNQRYGQEMSKIAARGAEQRKTKQTRGAGSTVTHVSNGGGAGAGSGGGAPAQ